jgi:two-component system cell cycle sensor histidine kinase/response regulator CckA
VTILRNSISKASVLKTDLSKNLPPVWANPTHIRQVVMNLIINAAEAIGDAGGTIHIRTSRVLSDQDSGTHPASIRRRSCYVRLEVLDTGSGMTEEEQTRIFAPDFTTKGNGHGLGLALVQETVHSHGGSIKVASAPGRGTTFEILLPCAQFHVGSQQGKATARDDG